MQSPNEIICEQRDVAQLIVITDSKITENVQKCKRKCCTKNCNEIGCRKFWHRLFQEIEPGPEGHLLLTVLGVGLAEIWLGITLIMFVTTYKEAFDKLYSNEIIRTVSILGLLVLVLCGAMLLVSILMDNRKTMLVRIMISTGWAGYVLTLSVLKLYIALQVNEPGASTTKNLSVYLHDAGMIELFILLITVFHFFGDLAVFAYYDIRFLHPVLISSQ